jgi:hypothetical protein
MSDPRTAATAEARFEETQSFRQWWLLVLLLLVLAASVGAFGWGIYQQLVLGRPWGDRPLSDGALVGAAAVTIPLVLLLVGGLWFMRLTVRVEQDALAIRFAPFTRRRIPWSDVLAFAAVTYHPVREYGGWGIRGFASNRAYNVSGNRGVRLRLAGDRRLLIGSQRADELAAAIAAASGKAPGGVE